MLSLFMSAMMNVPPGGMMGGGAAAVATERAAAASVAAAVTTARVSTVFEGIRESLGVLFSKVFNGGRNSNDSEKSESGKPERVTNQKHHQNSQSPEPKNVEELYENFVEAGNGSRWASRCRWNLHRFSPPRNGQTHWNGSTAGNRPIRQNNIPPEIKKVFGVTK